MKRIIGAILGATLALSVPPRARRRRRWTEILKEKKVRITAEVTSPPFGFIDQSGQPDGLEIAVARQVAKDLGVELDLVQVPATGRIPSLLAGRADIAISSLSVTLDRVKTVAFADPHGALTIVITAPAEIAIKSMADLAGKRVALTRARRSRRRRSPSRRRRGRSSSTSTTSTPPSRPWCPAKWTRPACPASRPSRSPIATRPSIWNPR